MKKISMLAIILAVFFCVSAHAEASVLKETDTATSDTDVITETSDAEDAAEATATSDTESSDESDETTETESLEEADETSNSESSDEETETSNTETEEDSGVSGDTQTTEETQDVAGSDSDESGKDSEVIEDEKIDSTPPVIRLIGDASVEIERDQRYEDAGAAAEDDLDGDITDLIEVDNQVDTRRVGVYTVTYAVSDNAGNMSDEVVRIVEVIDIEPVAAKDMWRATITAEGRKLDGVHTSKVVFGIGSNEKQLQAPPPPPEYTVLMELLNSSGARMFEEIRDTGSYDYIWIIGVDPHGNMGDPSACTSRVSWEPSELTGPGTFELRNGYDGMGELLVADMKRTASFEVNGTEGMQFFSIVYTPE